MRGRQIRSSGCRFFFPACADLSLVRTHTGRGSRLRQSFGGQVGGQAKNSPGAGREYLASCGRGSGGLFYEHLHLAALSMRNRINA